MMIYLESGWDSWRRGIVIAGIGLITALLRKYLPSPRPVPSTYRYDAPLQEKEPLPTGVIGGTMWGIGICIALSFFLLKWINHIWADTDGEAIVRNFAASVFWCFLPGFGALAVPWPLTIWLLKRFGRT